MPREKNKPLNETITPPSQQGEIMLKKTVIALTTIVGLGALVKLINTRVHSEA